VQAVDLSVVVPVYNEVDSLERLKGWISDVLDGAGYTFEIIFADDGSTDGSRALLEDLLRTDDRVRLVKLTRNYGKAAALSEGFKIASGPVIVTMDADLQDDPKGIPSLLAKLDEGYDVVSGWKRGRKDPWHKTIPSKWFNVVTSRISGLHLKDHNSGLKAYRAEVLEEVELVGEMHRFITVMAHWHGRRVTEIPVEHHPRAFGQSKYGSARLLKGALDLLTVLLTTRYNLRPLHLFGLVGMAFGGLGVLLLLYLSVLWFAGHGPIGTRPLLFLGLLLTVVGVQLVSTGLLAELIIRRLGTDRPRTISDARHDRR